jgi:hypothetical protein
VSIDLSMVELRAPVPRRRAEARVGAGRRGLRRPPRFYAPSRHGHREPMPQPTLADVAKTHSVAPAGNTGARVRVAEEPKSDTQARRCRQDSSTHLRRAGLCAALKHSLTSAPGAVASPPGAVAPTRPPGEDEGHGDAADARRARGCELRATRQAASATMLSRSSC